MKPVYFDLTVGDLSKARAFFEAVFGWKFERFPMPYEYYRITAGAADEPGIDGGMGSLADAAAQTDRPMVSLMLPVEDLGTALDQVVANGGKVTEPRAAIPGVGWMATCAEPGGLRFGLLEADPEAT
jgi:uncharacterized protein